ncbi:MAG: phage holin family protein [Pseudoclavibacter sp.]|nr:phage holin family protein [Pseudoclavibacter sp.]
MRFVLSVLVNAFSLFLTTLVVAGTRVTPFEDSWSGWIGSYLLLGLLWGLVNSTIGSFIRVAGFCFYIVTLGLVALVVNGFLFWIVAWLSGHLGFGLTIDGFGWAVLAALVMSVLTAVLGSLLRPRGDED